MSKHDYLTLALTLIALIGMGVTCFYTGMIVERYRWNALIHKGILPKPRNG